VEGITWFPRVKPLRMLRIFRTRFGSLADAEAEVRRVKAIETYLVPDHLARSEEFLVDYVTGGQRETLLCGLQEFVEGEILEPWSALDRECSSPFSGRWIAARPTIRERARRNGS